MGILGSFIKRWRATVAVASTVSLVTTALVASAVSAADADRAGPQPVKITEELEERFAEAATQDFWILMSTNADTTAAADIADWAERGEYVAQTRRTFAASAQAPVLEALAERGTEYTSYWVVNAIRVNGGSYALATDLAGFSGVESLILPVEYELDEPVELTPKTMAPDAVQWNIADINADDVWDQYGVRGEGITVANVDTGVDYTHPALVDSYRGNNGDGTFDHDYNWFDAAGGCGDAPCDSSGQGTHTMGTMVGADGGIQIGVAPGATWITTNGCCPSDAALLDSMQWILEPTDLDGENPDPSRRPHIVNNSWATIDSSDDPFGEEIQQGWNDSGIFGSWSNGSGYDDPDCGSSLSPGNRIINYSVGAYDSEHTIHTFSARGAGQDGEIKPNISAPGVGVISSRAGGGYGGWYSAAASAPPHVSGAVALLWSAAPAMVGDIDGTRALLDQTAIDSEDLQCGGTADDNNVYGEGRLDALALVDAAPIGDAGLLAGTVTDEETGDPIAGADITVTGPVERETTTDQNGAYSLTLSTGTYEVRTTAFGYETQTQTAEITVDVTTTVDFALAAAPSFAVSGTVTDAETGDPVADATITIDGTAIPPATTDQDGSYGFESVPAATYDLTARATRCDAPQTQTVTVDGGETVDFALPQRADEFGYTCSIQPASYLDGDTLFPLTGTIEKQPIDLPFPFILYGETYQAGTLSSSGFLTFVDIPHAGAYNYEIPSSQVPNAAVYPFWNFLDIRAAGGVYTGITGAAPNRGFIVEYRNVNFFDEPATLAVDFEMILWESGDITFVYRNLDPDHEFELGDTATVGIENAAGTVAFDYSYLAASLSNEAQIHFTAPPLGFAQGTVTDANDGQPIGGAAVAATDAEGAIVAEATTDEDGSYRLPLPPGEYSIMASAAGYSADSVDVILSDEETLTVDLGLETATIELDPDSFEFVVRQGETGQGELVISNDGTQPLEWEISEVDQGTLEVVPERPALLAEGADRSGVDLGARTTQGLWSAEQLGTPPMVANNPGEVLEEWPAVGLDNAWGAGYDDGDVWVSDSNLIVNKEYATTGEPTGVEYPADWAGAWNADMAADHRSGLMCQVEVASDGGDIVCWDPATGEVGYRLSGGVGWSAVSQRGLAYNEVDDVFYIGGWNQGILYTVAGQSHPTPGETLDQCFTEENDIAGLAYNPTADVVWMATNTEADTIYQITTGCATISTIADPNPAPFTGVGLSLDPAGNLWAPDYAANVVRLIDSGVPHVSEVPWLSVDGESGSAAPGESDEVTLHVDTTGLESGTTYQALLLVTSNAGRTLSVQVPVRLGVDLGQLTGTVTDAGTGDPIEGATVTVTGPADRETETDQNGGYSFGLDAGTYDITVTAFGYTEQTGTAEVVVGETTTVDFELETGETYVLTGRVRVRDTGERLPGATVTIEGTSFTMVTNHTGRYRFTDVPAGTYDIIASDGPCLRPRTKSVVIDGEWPDRLAFRGDERKRFRLGSVTDSFGHTCLEEEAAYVEADTLLDLTGDDESATVDLPFSFPFYGETYDTVHLATNGHANFLAPDVAYSNTELPDPTVPNALIAPFWDDLLIDVESAVYSSTGGDAGSQWFTVEWRNAALFATDGEDRVDFSVTMHENGEIVTAYRGLDPDSDLEIGSSATIGIENEAGTDALQYSYNEATLTDNWAIRFTPPADQ